MLIRACAALALVLVVPAAAAAQVPPPTDPPVVLAAGDIASCQMLGGAVATARLLDRNPGTVLTLGDNAYRSGLATEFEQCYGPTWGRHRDRTRPSMGNHDAMTKKGQPYYDYFGDRAGPRMKGYYSFDLGAWHLVALNSTIDVSSKSEQMRWLEADLAAHPSDCILAYWHEPVFSSGPHGLDPHMKPAWKLLLAAGAEIVLNGHDHMYERFAPQDENARATPTGIREFVVGTGGGGVYNFRTPVQNSEARNNTSYGVLKLTLRDGAYDWEYLPTESSGFTDRGSGTCTPKP